MPTRLGHGWVSIRSHARPGAHAHVDSLLDCFYAQISPPLPHRNVGFHRALQGVDAEVAIPSEDNGADITFLQGIDTYRLQAALYQLLSRVGNLRSVDLAGIGETLNMAVETKYFRPSLGLVAANPLEQRASVMNNMRHHMDLCVVPGYQPAVVPDFPTNFVSSHVRSVRRLVNTETMLVALAEQCQGESPLRGNCDFGFRIAD